MKFQRRILPPHSPTYLEMEEYATPSSSRQSSKEKQNKKMNRFHFCFHRLVSIAGSTSDLSEMGSIYCLANLTRQRSDSLTNLFHMSDDSASLSNLSIASYSLSQNSCDNASFIAPTNHPTLSPLTVSSQMNQTAISTPTTNGNGSDKMSRKQYSSSYRNLTEEPSSPINIRSTNNNQSTNSRRSGDAGIGANRHYHFPSTNPSGTSSTTSSQKSFPIKTAGTVLNTIGLNKSSSNNDLTDKCGLIANDGNDLENVDDDDDYQHHSQHHRTYPHDDVQSYCDNPYVDSSDENDLDSISARNTNGPTTQTARGLRKTVLNNVDRILNSGNKQIKL